VITSNFWPELTGTSQTVTEFARFAADRGADVHVATSLPYYPEWRIWPAYRRTLWKTERWAGLTIHRSWHMVAPRPSTWTRVVHEVTLSAFALPNLFRVLRHARVAYIVTPALSYAWVASVIAALLRVRRVLVVKDIMPDAAVELGMLRNKFVIAVSRQLARQAYALAHEIHTLGVGMRNRIARVIGDATKIHIVPDTVDGNELAPVRPDQNNFRRRFVPEGTFAVVHTGNMGRKQDLDLLLRAARRLRDERGIHFFVFGDGAAKADFLERSAEWKLDNVSHYPLQERSMLPHVLSGADVVLVSQLAEVVDIVVPSKLITALGAGALIVAACAPESETARIIAASDGGIVIPASDDAALVEEIKRIRRGQVPVAAYRERARRFALERFGREAVYGPITGEMVGSRSSVSGVAAREPTSSPGVSTF